MHFAQAQVADTLVYLRQIENNKSKYINQPFSLLLNDLKIIPMFFSPGPGITSDISKETSTSFYFIIPEFMEDFGSYNFEIEWTTPLNSKISGPIYDNGSYRGEWRPEAEQFYKIGIVKDISVIWLYNNNADLEPKEL